MLVSSWHPPVVSVLVPIYHANMQLLTSFESNIDLLFRSRRHIRSTAGKGCSGQHMQYLLTHRGWKHEVPIDPPHESRHHIQITP